MRFFVFHLLTLLVRFYCVGFRVLDFFFIFLLPLLREGRRHACYYGLACFLPFSFVVFGVPWRHSCVLAYFKLSAGNSVLAKWMMEAMLAQQQAAARDFALSLFAVFVVPSVLMSVCLQFPVLVSVPV